MYQTLLKRVTALLLILLLISGVTACDNKSAVNDAIPTAAVSTAPEAAPSVTDTAIPTVAVTPEADITVTAEPTASVTQEADKTDTAKPTAVVTHEADKTDTVKPTAAVTHAADKTDAVKPTAAVTHAADKTDTAKATPTESANEAATPDYISDGTARVTVDGTKFIVDEKELWINGVNTPWNNWNDFGSSGFNASFWDDHFAKLEEAGINASRVWINCDGMVGVYLNPDGSFQKVTDKHWQDLDTLFSIAKKHHIYIMATLLSFNHFKVGSIADHYWRSMITSSSNIDSFVNGYVIPFVERYDKCDYLWSVDLMNEPDWVYENQEDGKIDWKYISDYFARASAGIHENSDVLVTVGLAMPKYNSDSYSGNVVSDKYLQKLTKNKDSYLDFYSTHYYIWERPWFSFPFDKSPTAFKLDGTKPSVIGECASLDNSGWTITQKYEGAYNNGWNGVMAWTSNGVDSNGGFNDVEPAAKHMLDLIPELIHPLQ